MEEIQRISVFGLDLSGSFELNDDTADSTARVTVPFDATARDMKLYIESLPATGEVDVGTAP